MDTVFNYLTDTIFWQKDSVSIVVLRDTVLKKTYINVSSPSVERSFTVTIPVVKKQFTTWKNWWEMTVALISRFNFYFPLLMILFLMVILFKFINLRK